MDSRPKVRSYIERWYSQTHIFGIHIKVGMISTIKKNHNTHHICLPATGLTYRYPQCMHACVVPDSCTGILHLARNTPTNYQPFNQPTTRRTRAFDIGIIILFLWDRNTSQESFNHHHSNENTTHIFFFFFFIGKVGCIRYIIYSLSFI